MICDPDPVTFGTQNLSFGRPGAPLWHPGGPWDDPGDTWEHKKGDLGIQACILIDFGWISGPHLESFSDTLSKNRCLFHVCFQVVFLNDLLVLILTPAFQKQAFVVRGVAKINFSQKLKFC